ncbi:SRPBCC family protein [Streptomyces sp. NPDC000658]|uniref:SRPBCC family protein n=1 Tax=Streptomyces sp. NPDC000658 TaxID=3154266 RepID=UPI0033336BBC
MPSTRSTTRTARPTRTADARHGRRGRRPERAAAVVVAFAAAGFLTAGGPAAQAAPRPASAPVRHDGGACRGHGVDPSARIRYHSDVVIHASLGRIWRLQTDVERWPDWQPPVTGAERLDAGPLRKGSRFRWTTPAPATPTTPATTLKITSTVRQLQRGACVLWSGPAVGEGLRIDEGVHLWTFTEVDGGVRVHTEETWTGAQVEADVPTATAALGAGLEAWLHDLKTTAERA